MLRCLYQGMYIVSQLLRLTTDTYHVQRHTLAHTQRPLEQTPLPPGVDPLPRVGDPTETLILYFRSFPHTNLH